MGLNPGAIGSLSGHYSYHTLQPTQSGAHAGQHHLIGAVNSPYAQIGANSSAVYGSKMMSRTPPYPIVNSSSATSPSASSSSNSSSSNHSTQGTQLGNSANNGGNNATTSSSSAESHEYEPGQVGVSPSNNSVPNPADPAEIVRQKQMRGLKLTQDELQLLVKDRQRKDNHNMSKSSIALQTTTTLSASLRPTVCFKLKESGVSTSTTVSKN